MNRISKQITELQSAPKLPFITTRFTKPINDSYTISHATNSQTSIISLRTKFPHKIFSIGKRVKVRSAGNLAEGESCLKNRVQIVKPDTRDTLETPSNNYKDILLDMENLKRDCVMILNNRLEESNNKLTIKNPLPRIKVRKLGTLKLSGNLNRSKAFYFGIDNTPRNKNVCERFNSGRKLIPLHLKDRQNIFVVKPSEDNSMYQTAYFGTKEDSKVIAKPRARYSAVTLNNSAAEPKNGDKKTIICHKRFKYIKQTQSNLLQ